MKEKKKQQRPPEVPGAVFVEFNLQNPGLRSEVLKHSKP